MPETTHLDTYRTDAERPRFLILAETIALDAWSQHTDVRGVLLTRDGEPLAEHVSSSVEWLVRDLVRDPDVAARVRRELLMADDAPLVGDEIPVYPSHMPPAWVPVAHERWRTRHEARARARAAVSPGTDTGPGINPAGSHMTTAALNIVTPPDGPSAPHIGALAADAHNRAVAARHAGRMR